MTAVLQFALSWSAALFVMGAQAVYASSAEPFDFVLESCTQVSDDLDGVLSNLEAGGWIRVSDLSDSTLGEKLAIAKIGTTTSGNPTPEKWRSSFELRAKSAQAELAKPEQDFFQSALLKSGKSDDAELLYVTWIRINEKLASIDCAYAGYARNNRELVEALEETLKHSGIETQLVFVTEFGLETGLSNTHRATAILTVISKEKAELKFGRSLPADLGLQTKLTVYTGS